MCLFIPDTRNPQNCLMHVLLLALDQTRPMCGMDMPRHYPRVSYNAAYSQAGAKELTGDRCCISMDDKLLDLGTRGSIDGGVALHPMIADLTPLVPPLDPQWVTSEPGLKVAARVTLPPGSVTPCCGPDKWRLGRTLGQAAFEVTWTCTMNTADATPDQLEWELGGLRGDGGQPLVSLHPIADEKDRELTIDLLVTNVPAKEPIRNSESKHPKPQHGDPVPHFAAYYDLFDVKGPDLTYDSGPSSTADGSGGLAMTSDAYTCMTAQAPLSGNS